MMLSKKQAKMKTAILVLLFMSCTVPSASLKQDWQCGFSNDHKHIFLDIQINTSQRLPGSDLFLQHQSKFKNYTNKCKVSRRKLKYNLHCLFHSTSNIQELYSENYTFRITTPNNSQIWERYHKFDVCKDCSNCHVIRNFHVTGIERTRITLKWNVSKWEILKNNYKLIKTSGKKTITENFQTGWGCGTCSKIVTYLKPCTQYTFCLKARDNIRNIQSCVPAKTLCPHTIQKYQRKMTTEVKLTLGTLAGISAITLSMIAVILKIRRKSKLKLDLVPAQEREEIVNHKSVFLKKDLKQANEPIYEEIQNIYEEIYQSKELVIDDDIDEVFVDTNDDYVYAPNVSEVDWYSDTYTDDYTMDETYSVERIKSLS
ncbi:uncharacterized protein LOC130630630 [Hydractinia symbiolongicarpus]|uniref:uncharacterized protein LOC130630630 n=1 Tax=Hydractinia symbiolongicarpus TaxID=13093 RepID=UPI0025513651|nr:uncharacterized protein LOC130630630 [Hydractinia symbiolongicarpus]